MLDLMAHACFCQQMLLKQGNYVCSVLASVPIMNECWDRSVGTEPLGLLYVLARI